MQPATSDKTFHLKWNNHLQNLSQLFTTIYSSSALADVTLSCRDGSIRAHKLVLSACSPYFEQIFKENPCKHPVIILKGIPYAEINLLVEFMYKGSVDVQELDLQSLMHTASELEIRGLAYEIRKDASSLLNVNLNEYPNFPTAPSIVQDSSFTAAFDTAAQACSSPYDSTPRNVNPYQTNLERLRQIHMYQQAMCRNTPYTTASTQAATDVSSIKRKRKNDEPMPATTTTAVKNILAAAAKELAEKQSSSNTTSIQTEEDVQIIDLKVEKEDEEEEAPLHSRDTRYKGKKRVSVGLQNDYAPVAPKNKSAPVNVEGIMPQGILKCVDLQNLRESRDNVTNTIEDNDDSSALDTSDDNHQPMETTYENVAEPDDEYDSSDSKQESSVNPKKVYKCDLCDLSYSRNAHMIRHRRTHSGERPYKCTSCPYSFNRSSHLARHRRTHTGERPYRCEACGRCFARGDKLKLHMRICEKDEYVLPGQTAVVDESKNPVKKDVSQAMVPGMVSIGHSERHQLMFTPSGEVMLAPRVHGESREPIPEINTSINTEHPNQSMAEPSSLTPVSTSERLNYSDSGYPIKRGRGRPRKKPLPPVELPIVKKKRGRPPKIIKIDPMEPGRSMDNYTSSNLPYGDFSYLTDIISTHFNQSTQQAYQNMMQMNPMITANALTSALSSQGGLSTLVPAALQNLENFKNQVILKDKLHAAALAHQSTSQPESSVRNSSISSPPPMNIIHNADVNPQSSTKTKDMEKKENDKIAGMEMINTKINLNNCDEDKSDRATLEDLEKSTQKVVMIGDCQIVKLSDKYSSAAEASETKSNAASIGDCTIQPIPQNE